MKSSDEVYNFAFIQEDGEVSFYGIVNKTEVIGDKQIGITYLAKLAKLVGGQLYEKLSGWNWGVRKHRK